MLNFSEKKQAFYDLNLNYKDLPDDLIELTDDQHSAAYSSLQNGCYIFSDLSCSAPRPTQFHKWDEGEWVDKRTPEEIRAEFLRTLTPLTRRQFKLALLEHNLLETTEQAIDEVPDKTLKMRIQIEYSESERFERSNESVQYMLNTLNLTETQVDEMWLYARKL